MADGKIVKATGTGKGARARKRAGKRGAPAMRPRPLADSVLRLVWRERRISRADIARQADLSRSTVSEIVGSFLPTGLVSEIGAGPSRGGRRPIVLEFQDGAACILGVEMGATHVNAALTDLRGRVLAWKHRSHPVRTDPEGTRALIAELCDACLAASPRARERLVGIGVAVPCPVHPDLPDALSEIVLPDWKGRAGLDQLSARYGAPLFVDNDANLGALAEQWWGAGRGVDDFAYIKVATGVGSGHVVGGRIYRGATGVAGEIGHIAVVPGGLPCICGLHGCLATVVGSAALVERARSLLDDHADSSLRSTALDIDAIENAALAGDPLALQVTREAAEHLGIAVAEMLNLLNPSLVVLGGGLARLGELLVEPLREVVKGRTLVTSVAATEIRTSDLGPRTVAIGAATRVLEAALANPSLFPGFAPKARTA
jgi:glucokinase-like ROK family protein